tara:strand:- start:7546 stop:8223 length:678 start_codon:yes stop_codon:yes gene_type:complete
MKKINKIFIAIDTKNEIKAKSIIKQSKINSLKIGYKFGLEFINSKNGRNFISRLKNEIVFIDLKLHDIPNTMKSTLIALKDIRFNYLTVHISSGFKALQELKKISKNIKIVGVTTLTSLDNNDLKKIGYSNSVNNIVLKQSKLANKARLDAIVCSPKEVPLVKKVFKGEIITPGIRIKIKNIDQKRTMTPKQAFQNGSDWLVIGREITKGNVKKNVKNLSIHLKE